MDTEESDPAPAGAENAGDGREEEEHLPPLTVPSNAGDERPEQEERLTPVTAPSNVDGDRADEKRLAPVMAPVKRRRPPPPTKRLLYYPVPGWLTLAPPAPLSPDHARDSTITVAVRVLDVAARLLGLCSRAFTRYSAAILAIISTRDFIPFGLEIRVLVSGFG